MCVQFCLNEENKITEVYKVKGVNPNCISLVDVTTDNVQKQLSSLDITELVQCDRISARFPEKASQVIATRLTHINLSLETGVVPSDFKTARVVPLFKKGDCSYEGNYRPVSI